MTKRMTRQEWESYIPHGYAEMRNGVPYLLYLSDTEGTVWGPVEFKTDAEGTDLIEFGGGLVTQDYIDGLAKEQEDKS